MESFPSPGTDRNPVVRPATQSCLANFGWRDGECGFFTCVKSIIEVLEPPVKAGVYEKSIEEFDHGSD